LTSAAPGEIRAASIRQSGSVSVREQPEAGPVAVIGAGSVGCMMAAHLAAAGSEIVICGREPVERVVMTIDGEVVEHKVAWAAEPAELPAVRFAVLATKIHHTPEVADWLGALPAGSAILAAQNGVDHRARIAPLTPATVVPTLVYPNAERTGPGQVRVRRTGRGLVVPGDDAGRAAAALFDESGLEVEAAGDFTTAAWEKLLYNVIANPLTALTGRPLEVLHEPAMAALGLGLALEAVEVARAEGAALTPEHARMALTWLQGLPGVTPSSMYPDRAAGRTMEHQGLLGPIVVLGQAHGVPAPLTGAILALLDALPAGGGGPGARTTVA
jgi:2-dehydropantoate 2-reductase